MLSPWWKRFWYELLYYPTAGICCFGFSLRSAGRHHVPRKGGFLVIANHQSFMDPPLVGLVVRRHLKYLARKTLFGPRLFTWFIDSLGAVPINQEAPGTEGIKAALSLLKAGERVLIFPEGARTRDGAIHPLKPGVVLLIRRAGVPVLPVGIAGAYEAWPIQHRLPRLAPLLLPANGRGVALVVGKPMDSQLLTKMPPEQMLEHIHGVLSDLKAKAERLRRKE